MSEKIKYGTVLPQESIQQVQQIAGVMRWSQSTVVEVAIDWLHKRLISSPTDTVTISEVESVADRLLGVTNEAAINPS